MPGHVLVPDLGAKIDLLLRSDKGTFRRQVDLSAALGIEPDYLSRIKRGSRGLTEENFIALCDIFDLQQRQWFDDLETFGNRLGFSRRQVSLITNSPLPGIDFTSRIKDKGIVTEIFNVIRGYWVSYHYSVSRTDKKLISRDLFIVRGINEDEYIECEIIDGSFRYSGWCFPIKNHLYIVLEKADLFTEIIVYATNLPDRQPPRLYGIILCLSGGIEETASHPSASKTAFKYIGKEENEIRRQYQIPESVDVEDFLVRNIPSYVDPETEGDPDTRRIFAYMSNTVRDNSIPYALRMTV